MKELTLKQLYGYSVMNWEQYLIKIIMVEKFRYCSFCVDLEKRDGIIDYDLGCYDCKINPFLCYRSGTKGYFDKINKTTRDLCDKIHVFILQLRLEHDKL